MKADNIVYLSFEETKVPEFTEQKGKEWIFYGKNNLYPQELINLFNRSAKHNAIVTGKAGFIQGNGLIPKDKLKQAEFDLFEKTLTDGSTQRLFYKSVLDFEIYNGFALEMIPSSNGRWNAYHIDFARLRISKDRDKIFYSEDWSKYKQTAEDTNFQEYPLWDANKKKKSILYFCNYRPKAGLDYYTYPDYIGAVAYIECDYQIANFHVNNLRHGFTGATIINFFNGEPTPEEQKKIEAKLKKKFAGTDNAGGIVLVFSDNKSKEPKIENILPSDFDKQFDILNKTVQQEIFTGHKITSPMLFGIKTEGQLGGRDEIKEAYELFQNTYINEHRNKVLEVYNKLAALYNVGELDVRNTEPVGLALDMSAIVNNMTRDEIRVYMKEKMGIDIDLEKQEVKVATNPVVDAINSLSPLVANNVLGQLTPNELRGLIGMQPIPNGDTIQPTISAPLAACKHDFSKEEEDKAIEIFSQFGTDEANYDFVKVRSVHRKRPFLFEDVISIELNKTQGKILGLIKSNPLIGINEIATALELDSDLIASEIETLKENGMIKQDGANYKVTSAGAKAMKENKVISLKSLYKYALSPYIKGEPDILPDDRTRPFCERLLNLKKLYSRKELDDISDRLGYDVWTRRGGFYTNPNTGETTPFCRHIWQSVTVIEK